MNTFLVKVASRCNLECSYCYMYKHADQSWRRRPRFMPSEVLDAVASRIEEHARDRCLPRVTVLLHGGEPLLAGPERISRLVEGVRRSVGRVPGCEVTFSMQTNATMLTPAWLEALERLGVDFGVSLDGDRVANDRHRLDAGGKSSYEDVAAALRLLQEDPRGRRLFRGILAVISLENDPVETYQALKAWNPPRLDFLFPDGNHAARPPGIPMARAPRAGPAPYADWLIAVFDQWFANPGSTRIRLFENTIDLLLGGASQTEGIGPGTFNLLTIETDGEFEDVDLFKAAFPGAGAFAGMAGAPSVLNSSITALMEGEAARRRAHLHGPEGLSPACLACDIRAVCGGGFVPHRYATAGGFSNPSVYCTDLFKLIRHIDRRLAPTLAPLLAAGAAERRQAR